jgi:hypothetical protein
MASQAVDGEFNAGKVWINLYRWEPFLLLLRIVLMKRVNSAAKIAAARIGLANRTVTQW